MRITKESIDEYNKILIERHNQEYQNLCLQLLNAGIDWNACIEQIAGFQVAIPTWALGAGGTRFGRFGMEGEPANLVEKIDDVGIIHALTRSAGAISLHIPWDIPDNPESIKALAAVHGLHFDAVNSNTFQDQPGQDLSYKFGSLCHAHKATRSQAIAHNKKVIDHGKLLGSKSITVWLADGSSFPGQLNFRNALERTLDSLKEIYNYMPHDWKMFIEYKPYEPNFYSTVIQDWGTSYLLANECGERALCLVDLGHHLPNTNIEQIVATLMWRGKLGGFHFNDSKYGDDDLTVGSIKPYQLFLIFNELVYGMKLQSQTGIAWMIDASHNVKDPLEDLMQSIEAILLAYAQALLVNHGELNELRRVNDVTMTQELLQNAYRTDVRPLIREARLRLGGALDPIGFYRVSEIRKKMTKERGVGIKATGL